MTKREYSAKILLFGEYSILMGSKALIMPFHRFKGHLVSKPRKSNNEDKQDKVIKKFVAHLSKTRRKMNFPLDIDKVDSDLKTGLRFSSHIPVSYGLGSSGAFCAAIYNDYNREALNISDETQFSLFRQDLSLMESFFHGKSSGIDPLCILTGKVLLLQGEKIQPVPLTDDGQKPQVFLIDTLTRGETGKLVDKFREQWENQEFIFYMINHYIPLNDACISSFLCNGPDFDENIRLLSEYQLQIFREMVPMKELVHWKKGLESGLYSLKLCGSGGGGFLLGFTRDLRQVVSYFNAQSVPVLRVTM